MAGSPVSDEIAGALGKFFHGGSGPSQTTLTNVFLRSGYADADDYDPVTRTPNKEQRVQRVVRSAVRQPARSRTLVDALLSELRLHGCFEVESGTPEATLVLTAQRAFRGAGWNLSDAGGLSVLGQVDLQTGGRPALDEQLARLQAASEDPALSLGSAKDLLEAVAKFVLEEMNWPISKSADFNQLWHFARERVGALPEQVSGTQPGAAQVRKILGASWAIAEQVNELRNLQGTGHGRTLPTGVTADMARLVVREACSVAQYTLACLDRALGH